MAKSKEQKRIEGVERNIQSYIKHHMPTLSKRLPGGEWWELDKDHKESIREALAQLKQLLPICRELKINLAGERHVYDTGMSWSEHDQFIFLIARNNLDELRERMAKTYRMQEGEVHDAFMVDPSRGLKAIRELKVFINEMKKDMQPV